MDGPGQTLPGPAGLTLETGASVPSRPCAEHWELFVERLMGGV